MTAAEELGCQACGLAITPCLVCASSLPVFSVDDVLMKACCRCGFVNPLGEVHLTCFLHHIVSYLKLFCTCIQTTALHLLEIQSSCNCQAHSCRRLQLSVTFWTRSYRNCPKTDLCFDHLWRWQVPRSSGYSSNSSTPNSYGPASPNRSYWEEAIRPSQACTFHALEPSQ